MRRIEFSVILPLLPSLVVRAACGERVRWAGWTDRRAVVTGDEGCAAIDGRIYLRVAVGWSREERRSAVHCRSAAPGPAVRDF
jgi:hypothetical protein